MVSSSSMCTNTLSEIMCGQTDLVRIDLQLLGERIHVICEAVRLLRRFESSWEIRFLRENMRLCQREERFPQFHCRTHNHFLGQALKRSPCAKTNAGHRSTRLTDLSCIKLLESEPDIALPLGEEDLVPLPFAVEEETVQEQRHLSTRECPAGVQVAEDIRECHGTPDRIRKVWEVPLSRIIRIGCKGLGTKFFEWHQINTISIEENFQE